MASQVQFLGAKLLEKKYEIAKNVHEERLSVLTPEQKAQIPRDRSVYKYLIF